MCVVSLSQGCLGHPVALIYVCLSRHGALGLGLYCEDHVKDKTLRSTCSWDSNLGLPDSSQLLLLLSYMYILHDCRTLGHWSRE